MFRHLFLFVSFVFYSTVLFAGNELQRIDSMLHDISRLRKSYEAVIMQERDANLLLKKQLKECQKKFATLNNKINTTLPKRSVPSVDICKDDNRFPKLKFKK